MKQLQINVLKIRKKKKAKSFTMVYLYNLQLVSYRIKMSSDVLDTYAKNLITSYSKILSTNLTNSNIVIRQNL
jgi:hypothetical protein